VVACVCFEREEGRARAHVGYRVVFFQSARGAADALLCGGMLTQACAISSMHMATANGGHNTHNNK
jgi:hypothetical protein